ATYRRFSASTSYTTPLPLIVSIAAMLSGPQPDRFATCAGSSRAAPRGSLEPSEVRTRTPGCTCTHTRTCRRRTLGASAHAPRKRSPGSRLLRPPLRLCSCRSPLSLLEVRPERLPDDSGL